MKICAIQKIKEDFFKASLKPLQNKKGQKDLGYPRKSSPFIRKKTAFLALLILKRLYQFKCFYKNSATKKLFEFWIFSTEAVDTAWSQKSLKWLINHESYLSNKRTCPLILFKKKVQPTLWFSCNRLKIPPYPLILQVGWIFYPTRLL